MTDDRSDESTRTITVPLNSTWLASADYDPQTQDLIVTTEEGRDYTFSGVPPDVFAEFRAARSAGAFFHKRLKGVYG